MSGEGKENLSWGSSSHWVKVELSPRHVHVKFAGETVADSKRAMLMHEANHIPVYYFPKEDVRMDLMRRTDHSTH